MLVALVNPPWLQDGRVGIRAGSRWSYTVDSLGLDATIPFPFFLAQAAAMLRSEGFDVALMDGVAEQAEFGPYLRQVTRLEPDLVIYETSTPSFAYDCDVAERLAARLPEAKIAFCGPHATVFPEQTLREHSDLDCVLVGEYEASAVELAKGLAKGGPLDAVDGLVFRSGEQIVANPRRPLMADLDALPDPERDPAAIYRYHEALCARRPNVQLMSSRGCVFRCPFCLWPKVMYGGHDLRVRSPGSVVDEIERIEGAFRFREYYFDDDAINLDRGHVEGICEELERRRVEVLWSCMAHTGRASVEQLGLMRSAGCESIKWGVESGDAEVLASLGKGTTLEKVREVFAACRGLGIRTHATFTIGLPGETADSIGRTRDFMLELAPDSVQISIATPFPGTDMWQGGADMTDEDWVRFDGAARAVAGQGDLSADQLEQALTELQASWDAFARKREGVWGRIWRAARRRVGRWVREA